MGGMLGNAPGLYGPSAGGSGGEPTEIFFPYTYQLPGLGSSISGYSYLSTGSDAEMVVGAGIPSSWNSFDILVATVSENANTGNISLVSYYGSTFSLPSMVGDVVVPGASLTTATLVLVASGVPVVDHSGQVNVGRNGSAIEDTYTAGIAIYGILLRKAS